MLSVRRNCISKLTNFLQTQPNQRWRFLPLWIRGRGKWYMLIAKHLIFCTNPKGKAQTGISLFRNPNQSKEKKQHNNNHRMFKMKNRSNPNFHNNLLLFQHSLSNQRVQPRLWKKSFLKLPLSVNKEKKKRNWLNQSLRLSNKLRNNQRKRRKSRKRKRKRPKYQMI